MTIAGHELNPRRDMEIGGNLTRELRRQPALYTWYVQVAEMAHAIWKRSRMRAKERMEDVMAKLRKENPKLNPTALRNIAAQDGRLRAFWRRQIQAEKDARTMSGLVRAVDQRGKLLQSIGAKRRHELENLDRDHTSEERS